MRGMTFLVTGATGGLGAPLCRDLVARGAKVIAHCRSRPELDRLVAELGADARGVLADFASLAEVAELARTVGDFDVLVSNAGVGFGKNQMLRETSRDGHELRFAVNYLAPALLTHATIARTKAVVQVASAGQRTIDFDDLEFTKHYDGIVAYRRSKLAQVMLAFDLAAHQRVPINALHPGTFLDTHMVRESGITPQGAAQSGADAILHVIEQTLAGRTGLFFDRLVPERADAQAYDLAARARLHTRTLEIISPFLPS